MVHLIALARNNIYNKNQDTISLIVQQNFSLVTLLIFILLLC